MVRTGPESDVAGTAQRLDGGNHRQPAYSPDTSTLLTGGPWALFHLLDAGMVQETAVRGRQLVEYDFDGRRVVLEITAGRDFNPVSRELLQNFSCPARAL